MLTIRTDFKFHQTICCSCFNSHNDVPQVAQRNVSIVTHTRHRSRTCPNQIVVVLFHFHNDVIPSPHLSGTYPWQKIGASCVRPSPNQIVVVTPSPISAERIHGRSNVLVRLSPNHRYDSLNIYIYIYICINCCLLREKL